MVLHKGRFLWLRGYEAEMRTIFASFYLNLSSSEEHTILAMSVIRRSYTDICPSNEEICELLFNQFGVMPEYFRTESTNNPEMHAMDCFMMPAETRILFDLQDNTIT